MFNLYLTCVTYFLAVLTGLLLLYDLCFTCVDRNTFVMYLSKSTNNSVDKFICSSKNQIPVDIIQEHFFHDTPATMFCWRVMVLTDGM